jgi:hypothetical protein
MTLEAVTRQRLVKMQKNVLYWNVDCVN